MYDPARDIFKSGEAGEDGENRGSEGTNQQNGRAKEPNGDLRYENAYVGQQEASGNSHRSAGKEESSPGQPDSRRRGRQPQNNNYSLPSQSASSELTSRSKKMSESPRDDHYRGYSRTDEHAAGRGPADNRQQRAPDRYPKFKKRTQESSYDDSRRDYRQRDNNDNYGRDSRQDGPSRRRSRSPVARRARSPYRRRTPPPAAPVIRDPSPIPEAPPRSPPRQRKRPGQASRFSAAEKEILRKQQEERDRQAAKAAEREIQARGVDEVVRSHYNEKKELGKEWRTASRIKGLRSFNNWVKSVIIHKFSPSPEFLLNKGQPHTGPRVSPLLVLDMGCGKGGDLLKWKNSPQAVGLYVGMDAADVSVQHARDRYTSMQRERRGGRLFRAEFIALDCWSQWIGTSRYLQEIGIDMALDPQRGTQPGRWSSGGEFDIVTMMFCLHYSFESEAKCRGMLRNVATALKKGGRFFGTIPSSDLIAKRLQQPHKDGEEVKWGNSIYNVRFGSVPGDFNGQFKPPFGWRYSYFLDEAVEDVPEYVVPWEVFRALAEDYGLEFLWKKGFHEIWEEEKDGELGQLSERMGVKSRSDGRLLVSDEEWDAVGFYIGFAFRRV